jgi:hypothetical protein
MDMHATVPFALVFLGAGAAEVLAGDAAPRTPLECRQRVLQEIDRFRKMQGPDDLGGGDEHIARATLLHFHELKDRTTIILALAGDKDAVNALVKQYGLEQPSHERWIEDRRAHRGGPMWPRGLFDIAEIMDRHRPELAKKMRDEMRRLATGKDSAAKARANFDRLSLKELKQAALTGEGEAMLRWARLDVRDASPFLVQRMNDKKRSDYEQHLAAQALAVGGDARGLAWLRQSVVTSGAGGWRGAGLLRAGEAGQELFFELVHGYEQRKEELPATLSDAPLELDTDLFCKLLPRLTQSKDKKLRYHLDHAVRNHRLAAGTLSYLIDQARKDDRKESELIDNMCHSIIWNGVEDLLARDVAHLWTEELLNTEEPYKWEWGAKVFLWSGFGSKRLAAASARRQLKKSTERSVQVLAEAGQAEDAPSIWAATHTPAKGYTRNWYGGPSLGWFATVRLTNHLAPR